MPDDDLQADLNHSARMKLVRDYLSKLEADKEADRTARNLAAKEAEFKRFERRYEWTRSYYVWFCGRPRDEQEAIMNHERVKLSRKKKRGGKAARAYERLDNLTEAEKADRKRNQDRESYLRKKAAKAEQENAQIIARAIF